MSETTKKFLVIFHNGIEEEIEGTSLDDALAKSGYSKELDCYILGYECLGPVGVAA